MISDREHQRRMRIHVEKMAQKREVLAGIVGELGLGDGWASFVLGYRCRLGQLADDEVCRLVDAAHGCLFGLTCLAETTGRVDVDEVG